MRKALSLVIGLVLASNGAAMLGAPECWYHWIKTVPATGPFNAHFVRDIGCAYMSSAGGVTYFALNLRRGRTAAAVGATFLALHGLVHVWDAVAGRSSLGDLASDFIGVLVLPAVVFWLIWPRPANRDPKSEE